MKSLILMNIATTHGLCNVGLIPSIGNQLERSHGRRTIFQTWCKVVLYVRMSLSCSLRFCPYAICMECQMCAWMCCYICFVVQILPLPNSLPPSERQATMLLKALGLRREAMLTCIKGFFVV